jgi:hypothetical protein
MAHGFKKTDAGGITQPLAGIQVGFNKQVGNQKYWSSKMEYLLLNGWVDWA